jgi:hypothetical protein
MKIAMKSINQYLFNLNYRQFMALFVFMAAGLISGVVFAQEAEVAEPAVEEAAATAEEPELISPSVEFFSIQKADNTIDLVTKLQAKVQGNFIKLKWLKVTFFNVTEESETALGHVITNDQGKAVLNIKTDKLLPNADGQITFKAVYAGNKSIESFEEEIYVQRAVLRMTTDVVHSIYTANVVLYDLITGEETPVPDATVGLFVKRSFRPLPIGEATTDENGEASFEIPYGLPGNDKGMITLIARVDEHELFGNLEATADKPWGTPVSAKMATTPRALWSTRPPLWMMVTFIILITAVWGHYLVIMYELFRLKKEGNPK